MIERVFYLVEEGTVHISGELIYNGDSQLEYIEYAGCYIPVAELDDAICFAEEQSKQYYCKVTEEEGEIIDREYFGGEPGEILQLSDANPNTRPGCYVTFVER